VFFGDPRCCADELLLAGSLYCDGLLELDGGVLVLFFLDGFVGGQFAC